MARYIEFSKEKEEELFNILEDFIKRVSQPSSTDNTKTPEEVRILPAMIELFVRVFG